jgi:hypothetical protein
MPSEDFLARAHCHVKPETVAPYQVSLFNFRRPIGLATRTNYLAIGIPKALNRLGTGVAWRLRHSGSNISPHFVEQFLRIDGLSS